MRNLIIENRKKIKMVEKVLVFQLADRKYSVKSKYVKEILSELLETKIPNTPNYILGTVSYSGEVIPIIDLVNFFYKDFITTNDSRDQDIKYVIIEYNTLSMVFIVNSIVGQFDIEEERFFETFSSISKLTESFRFKSAFLLDNDIVLHLDNEHLFRKIIGETKEMETLFHNLNEQYFPKELVIPQESSSDYQISLEFTEYKQAKHTTDDFSRSKQIVKKETVHTFTKIKQKDIGLLINNYYIEEILTNPKIVSVPNSPDFFRGTLNYRGKIISIFNLANIINPTPIEKNNLTKDDIDQILIIDFQDQHVGLIIDEIIEVIPIEKNTINRGYIYKESTKIKGLIEGVYLDNNGIPLLIANVPKLLQIATNWNNDTLNDLNDCILFEKNNLNSPEQLLMQETIQIDSSDNGFLYFSIEDELFSFKTDIIIDILGKINQIRIPNTYSFITGVFSYHNEVIPIIDLVDFLYDKRKVNNFTQENANVNHIVLDVNNVRFAVKIQDILGIIKNLETISLAEYVSINDILLYEKVNIYDNHIIASIDSSILVEQVKSHLKLIKAEFISNNIFLMDTYTPEEIDDYNIQLMKSETPIITTPTNIIQMVSAKDKVEDVKHKSGIIVSSGPVNVFIEDAFIEEIFEENNESYKKIPQHILSLVGALNYRGEVIGVLDLNTILFMGKSNNETIENKQIIVLKTESERIALLIDRVLKWKKVLIDDMRSILSFDKIALHDYLFLGGFISDNDQFSYILNVKWLFQNQKNPLKLVRHKRNTLFFNNPEEIDDSMDIELDFEGVLIKADEHYFIIDTKIIKAIQLEQNVLLIDKNYTDESILGISYYDNFLPIFDFVSLLDNNIEDNKDSSTILVLKNKDGREFGLKINEIQERISKNDADFLKSKNILKADACNKMYKAFFSYKSRLGILIDSIELLHELEIRSRKEWDSFVSQSFFDNQLNETERKLLVDHREKQKELQFMLFDEYDKELEKYFAFMLHKRYFGIMPEVTLAVTNINYLENEFPNNNLIIGTLKFKDTIIPVINILELVFPGEEFSKIEKDTLLLLIKSNKKDFTYALPSQKMLGVITIYTEDKKELEDEYKTGKIDKVCTKQATYESIESPIFLLDNNFIQFLDDHSELNNKIKEIKKINTKQ